MKRIGAEIVGKKKAAALAEAKIQGAGKVKTSDMAGKDLLELLGKCYYYDGMEAID